MSLTIIILIVVLIAGFSVFSAGFLFNQEDNKIEKTLTPYEKLEKYKDELEKINQYNQQILNDLETKFRESESIHLEEIEKEIEVVKRIINDNKIEIEKVITKLSEMKDEQ